jgi:general secretion pathway protein K
MSRRGFVLLTVLWAVTLAGAVIGVAVAATRLAVAASDNRITLTRAAWARDGCAQILLARSAQDSSFRGLDTVDLGRGTWCRATLEDPGANLNVNLAESDLLRLLLANDSLADALLDWRDADDLARLLGAEADWYRARSRPVPRNGPLADIRELSLVRGFDSARVARFERLLTTRGTGQVNLGAAPAEVLAVLPGMTAELLRLVTERRAAGRLPLKPEELVGALSSEARRALLARYQDFARVASYGPTQLVATVEGGIRGRAPTARETLTLVPAPGRLAVVRREVE